MTSLINTIFEHLNFPKPIFDEKVTKTNLIPVVEELKNNDDDLENIVYGFNEPLRWPTQTTQDHGQCNYQITSFTHDNDQPIYVTWRATDNDESINKNQSITKGKTPNGKVLQITIVNENA